AHVPLASLVLVCELAGNYDLLVPLMLVQGIVFVALRKRALYSAQPRTQQDSPVYQQHATHSLLASTTVQDVMTPAVSPVTFELRTSGEEMLRHHAKTSWQEVFPVRGEEGRLVGMISAE